MTLRDRFDALAPRERLLVACAAVFAVFAVLVIGVLAPLSAAQTKAGEQLTDRKAVLADIERVAERFGPQAAGAAAVQPSGESLVVLIDRTTRSRNLAPYLKRNEPDGEASIRLRFENAPFDELIAWLGELHAQQGIGVISASADPGEVTGRVSANLQLARAPGR